MEVRELDPEQCYQALRARDARFDGRFYTAVVSTGIFCRPTCPAKTPKFDNCTFYRSAAAAHAAGFRPCLRCRPEVAPGLAGWRGTANTVRRALDLINEGALDHNRGARTPRDHRIRLKLPYKPPYDWPAMLDYLQARAIDGVEEVEGGTYRRSFDVGVVEVQPGGKGHLAAAIEVSEVGGVASVVARLRRLFDLDADVELIGEHLVRDARMAACFAKRPGLRVPGAWDGFETAVRAILGQQITVVAARKLAGKLVARFGEPLPKPFVRPRVRFPRPDVLAGCDIASIGMPKTRARAIASLAATVVSDPNLLSPVGDLDESIRRLKSLPGIGEWTAQYIAMRVLREPDAFPASDVGLLRAMTKRGANGEKRPTPDELLERAATWRPWRAYAAQHLWVSDADAR